MSRSEAMRYELVAAIWYEILKHNVNQSECRKRLSLSNKALGGRHTGNF